VKEVNFSIHKDKFSAHKAFVLKPKCYSNISHCLKFRYSAKCFHAESSSDDDDDDDDDNEKAS